VKRARLLALAILAACAAHARAAEPAPWPGGGWTVRKALLVRRKAPAAFIETLIAPFSAADGADLRVLTPDGNPADLDIVHRTPDGRFLILFDTAAGAGTYYLYTGRAGARPPEPWNPKIGLLLEVRTRPEGRCESWELTKRMIRDAREVQGVGFRDRIFDGFNPFGPSDDYISIYRGWLHIEQPGPYEFATTSDEASFLFIDGKAVCEWPGRHPANAGRNARFHGRVHLMPGPHRIEYYHVEYDGRQTAAAAWKPPGRNRFTIIPPGAFIRPEPAELVRTERRGAPATPDFEAHPDAYLELGGARLAAVQFRFAGSGAIRGWQWDFGDGTGDTGPRPVHVYAHMDTFDVALSVHAPSRRTVTLKAPLRVTPKWDDLDFREKKIQRFLELTGDYPFARMDPDSLWGLFLFFRAAEADAPLLKVCNALYPHRDRLPPPRRYELLVTTADHSLPNPDEALRLYQLARPLAEGDPARLFDLDMKIADALFYYKRDPRGALKLYEKMRADYPRTNPVLFRQALIRTGDCHRALGKADQAREAYRQAEQDSAAALKQPRHVLEGAWLASVTELLHRNQAGQALEILDNWEWQFPTARLDGVNLVLRARANLILNNFPEARKQAEIYLQFASDPDYRPRALLAAAEAARSLGDAKAARAHLQLLLDQYPESPLVPRAKGLLRLIDRDRRR
jgi:tetratricopeptide (TPR) repeat protein